MVKVKLDRTGKFNKREVSLLNEKFAAIIKDTADKNDVGENEIELVCESVSIRKKRKKREPDTTDKIDKTAELIMAIGFDESIENYLLDKHYKRYLKYYNAQDISAAAIHSNLLELSLDHQKQLVDEIIENRMCLKDRNLHNIALIAAQENQLSTDVSKHVYKLIMTSAQTLHSGLQQYANICSDVSSDQDQHLKGILVKVNDVIKDIVK